MNCGKRRRNMMRPRERQAFQRCLDLRRHRRSSTSPHGSLSLDCLAVGGLVAVSFNATMACLSYFICGGGTLLFALVCFTICGYIQLGLPSVGKLHALLCRCFLNAFRYLHIRWPPQTRCIFVMLTLQVVA